MSYAISIETCNSAFDDEPRAEVARILRDVADFLDNGGAIPIGEAMILRDINGNRVGLARHDPPRLAMSPAEDSIADAIEWAFGNGYEFARGAAKAFHDLTGWGHWDNGDSLRFTRSHAEEEGTD